VLQHEHHEETTGTRRSLFAPLHNGRLFTLHFRTRINSSLDVFGQHRAQTSSLQVSPPPPPTALYPSYTSPPLAYLLSSLSISVPVRLLGELERHYRIRTRWGTRRIIHEPREEKQRSDRCVASTNRLHARGRTRRIFTPHETSPVCIQQRTPLSTENMVCRRVLHVARETRIVHILQVSTASAGN